MSDKLIYDIVDENSDGFEIVDTLSNFNKNKEVENIDNDEEVKSDTDELKDNTNIIDKKKEKNKKKKLKNKLKKEAEKKLPEEVKIDKYQAPKSIAAKLALERLRLKEEEDKRIKALQEEEVRKEKEEERRLAEEKIKEEENKERKRKAKQYKILEQKKAGTYMTKSEKEKAKKMKEKLEAFKSIGLKVGENGIYAPISLTIPRDSKSDNKYNTKNIVPVKRQEHIYEAIRAPILCIMGHVDIGKTTLLDNIRGTDVQGGEAGGITQQIGATHFPKETLEKRINDNFNIKIPGILIIDTPGHEAFSNLRQRGSTLCDLAIVMIDIVHGVQERTKEVLKMLSSTNTPFIIALNKIDRLYGWNKQTNKPMKIIIDELEYSIKQEFDTRLQNCIVQVMEQGINSKLFWENNSPEDTVSIVPVSAITGEGIPDLLINIIEFSQERIGTFLHIKEDLECYVMEVSVTEGFGITMDVMLINGKLSIGNTIVIQTTNGPIKTVIRNLLTPPPNRETRIKSELIHHKELVGSIGVKIYANNISNVKAGSPIVFDNSNYLMDELVDTLDEYNNIIKNLDSEGVTVFASTMGSLEALLQFLKNECNPSIPVSVIGIGTISKKDIIKTEITNQGKSKEYCTILAFNVKIDEDAQIYAKLNNIKIFEAEIIYHLFDKYIKYKNDLLEQRKLNAKKDAVFPCVLKIIPNNIFNNKSPIILGVEVLEGNLHINTPLIIPILNLYVGKVTSIQNNHNEVMIAKKGSSVAIKIENEENPNIMFGRHFNESNELYSLISRKSIDTLKEYFKSDLTRDDALLIVKLKQLLHII